MFQVCDANEKVISSHDDQKQAVEAAKAYTKKTGKWANVVTQEDGYEGEVAWQPHN